MWSPIMIAYDWVHNAAQILENKAGLDGRIVQLCFQALLKAMSACQTWAGSLQSDITIFLKLPIVTGQDYSTATRCRVYPEPIMTWSMFLAGCAIITVVVLVERLLQLHLFYAAAFN